MCFAAEILDLVLLQMDRAMESSLRAATTKPLLPLETIHVTTFMHVILMQRIWRLLDRTRATVMRHAVITMAQKSQLLEIQAVMGMVHVLLTQPI